MSSNSSPQRDNENQPPSLAYKADDIGPHPSQMVVSSTHSGLSNPRARQAYPALGALHFIVHLSPNHLVIRFAAQMSAPSNHLLIHVSAQMSPLQRHFQWPLNSWITSIPLFPFLCGIPQPWTLCLIARALLQRENFLSALLVFFPGGSLN